MKGSFIFTKAIILKSLIGFFVVLITVSCVEGEAVSNEGEVAVKDAMKDQMNSWNIGDIPAFMNYYWNNDSLQFISKNGISKGWKKVLSNYQKAYPNQEQMGELLFELKEVRQVSHDCVFVVGSWNLSYSEKPNVGGYFTLLWKLKPEGWRIVIDHTS